MLTRQGKQRGFTLIEVLVSVLVLAIGLLGVAGLQVAGLRYNQSAHVRSQATTAIYDLVDKMRANPLAVAANTFHEIDSDEPPSDVADCSASSCTPEQLAAYDIKNWIDLITRLPGGAASVSYDSGDDVYQITVNWSEAAQEGDSAAASSSTVSMNVRL